MYKYICKDFDLYQLLKINNLFLKVIFLFIFCFFETNCSKSNQDFIEKKSGIVFKPIHKKPKEEFKKESKSDPINKKFEKGLNFRVMYLMKEYILNDSVISIDASSSFINKLNEFKKNIKNYLNIKNISSELYFALKELKEDSEKIIEQSKKKIPFSIIQEIFSNQDFADLMINFHNPLILVSIMQAYYFIDQFNFFDKKLILYNLSEDKSEDILNELVMSLKDLLSRTEHNQKQIIKFFLEHLEREKDVSFNYKKHIDFFKKLLE